MKKQTKQRPAKRARAAKAVKPIANLDSYRAKLEHMREDLMAVVRKKKEEVWPDAEVGDEGDVAVRSVQRDLVFELTDNERHLLDEVEAALRRIEKGTYGICEANGEKIAVARLKAMPYARYCVNCQSRFERA